MVPLIILGLLIGLPIVLLFVLRSNSAVVFLALCAGTVLLKYVGADASLLLSSMLPRASILAQEALNLTLLLIPAVATMVALRKSVAGPKIMLNLIPAVYVGALTALTVVPLLSVITSRNVMNTQAWTWLVQFQDFIVGAGILFSLLLIKNHHKKPSSRSKKEA